MAAPIIHGLLSREQTLEMRADLHALEYRTFILIAGPRMPMQEVINAFAVRAAVLDTHLAVSPMLQELFHFLTVA